MEGSHDRPSRVRERPGADQTLELTSAAFENGRRIPVDYTMDGKNRSPVMSWLRSPAGIQSYALVCEDPDAPQAEPFIHWVIFDIPAAAMGLPVTTLPEGIPKQSTTDEVPGAVQGTNDFGKIGYDGPAPPRGHGLHHYHFKLFALDRKLDLPPGASPSAVLQAMEGHILATGRLVGTYNR